MLLSVEYILEIAASHHFISHEEYSSASTITGSNKPLPPKKTKILEQFQGVIPTRGLPILVCALETYSKPDDTAVVKSLTQASLFCSYPCFKPSTSF